MMFIFLAAALVVCTSGAPSGDALGPCDYDGHEYQAGETITISHCLATMVCKGDNNYGDMLSLGGICPEKREVDEQNGCDFGGKMYAAGEKIVIQKCVGEMTCLGYSNLSPIKSYYGICPEKREADGQTGCNYDGAVYATGDSIIVKGCLGKFTCLGYNNISPPQLLGGQC